MSEYSGRNGKDGGPSAVAFEGAILPEESEEILKKNENKIVQPPENKIPVRAVPKTREEPDSQKIEGLSGESFAISAERNVDIVPEKGRQGDMPPAPEILYG